MASRVLSILLGSEVVKVCEVMLAGKKKVQVYNAIDLMIPSGLCEDGVIQDVNELAAAIKEGLSGEGFQAKKIVFTLNSKRIANKEVTIPLVKENRIKEIIRINATEYFPITNLEDYSLNYSILETIETDGIKQFRLSVTATPIELIEDYYALAKAMGMSVESVDFAGNSILQLLRLQATEAVCAILQMGNENTVVNIMNGNVLVMQRSVPYGRSTIADAVKEARGCTDSIADAILAEEDISSLAEKDETIADSVRVLFNSIGRILDFYGNRNKETPIESVKIIGDASSILGLAELFNREAEKPVELIDSLHGVEIKNRENVTDEIASNYLSNIGAVLNPVNVTLDEIKREQDSVKMAKLPWWALIVAGVAAIAMVGIIAAIYFSKKADNEALQAQIDSMQSVESIEAEYNQTVKEMEVLHEWVDGTLGANESLARLINDLEKVQPSSVSITKLHSEKGEVKIEGLSAGKRPLVQYAIELKKLKYVEDVHLVAVEETFDSVTPSDEFELTLKLKYADPLQEEVVLLEDNEEDSSEAGTSNNEGGSANE